MKSIKCMAFAAALLLCLVPGGAMAGEQANAPTVTGETGLFTLLSGETLPRGGWSFGLYYNNWDRLFDLGPVFGRSGDQELSLDWNRLNASVGYGLTDRWELSVSLPYDDFDFDEDDLPGRPDIDASGLGNARVGTKFRLLGEPGGAGSNLALNLFAEVPTGDDDVASDDTGFGGGLNWSASNWVASVGYRDLGNDALFSSELSAGIGYAAPITDHFDWITEVAGSFYDTEEGARDLEDAIDLTTGGRLWLGADRNWAFNFGLRTDLTQLSDIDEHCPLGGLVGLTLFPRMFRQKEEPVPEPPPPPPAPVPEPEPEPEVAPAPPPPPPPPAPAPKPEERVTVEFSPGSFRLSNIAKAKLDEAALKLKQDPELRAQVIGYTDAGGSASGNQKMSEQRAEAVKSYLVTRHGIDPSRITTEGRGSADSTGDVAQDRRAVVILTVQ
ncbi:MAG TPA: hypothetical protein DD490_34490 [Acidobacteria bacterium]|nr:hypothetical protein [Acidobacteriota bacterium]